MAPPPPNPEKPFSRRTALQLSLVYAAFTSAWIFFSDQLLGALVSDSASLIQLSSIKGFLFVGVTALLLFILLDRRPAAAADDALPADRSPWLSPALAFALFSLAMAGTGFALFQSAKRSFTHNVEDELAAITKLKVGQIERWLDERRNEAQVAMGAPLFADELRQWLDGGARDDDRRARLLAHLRRVSETSRYRDVSLRSAADGELLLTTSGAADSASVRAQAVAAGKRGGPVLDDFRFSPDGDASNIVLGLFSPVRGAAMPQPLAVAHLALDPAELLFPLLQQWPGSSTSAETVLLRRDADEVVYLNTLRHRSDTALRLRLPVGTSRLIAAAAVQGSSGPLHGYDYRNEPVLAYALPVAGTPWFVIAKIDEAEAYARFDRLAVLAAAMGGILLAVMAWWWAERNRYAAARYREQQSLSRLYATVSAANQAIVRSQSLEEAFRAICRACVDHGGFRMAWVGLADPDARRIVVTEAYGAATEYLDGIVIHTGADAPEGRGPTGSAYRDERVHVCNDFAGDPATAPWREKAARHGFRASIALPLRRGGKTVGALSVYAGQRNFFDDETVSLLKEMADNVSFAIDHFAREALRQQAEAALRLSEGRLREAQAVGKIGDWEIDLESGRMTWSPQVFRLFERDPACDAPQADEILAYYFPESAELTRVGARRVVDTGERIELEQRVRLPSGRTAYHASVMMPGKDAAGRVTKLYGTVQDVTERKRIEGRLRKLAEEIEDLYEHAPCGYHSVDADGMLCRINETELQWLGYSREEVLGRLNFADLLTPASRQFFQDNFPRFKESGGMRDLEQEMVRKDGTILPVLVSATAIVDAEGRFVMSRSTVYDMTERRKMEEERAEHARRLGELSRRLVAVQEEERRLLSGELHDRTSPNLAAIRINLGIIAAELPAEASGSVGSRLEDTDALLEDTTASIREICADLRPPILDHAGLLPALEGYALQFADRTGIPVRVGTDPAMRLATDVESLLFRIVQEALTNCAKHAGAEAIKVELRQVGRRVVLTISDDGVGFDPDTLGRSEHAPGLGLLTMRERAEFAGGKFSIESNPGKGTKIKVEI